MFFLIISVSLISDNTCHTLLLTIKKKQMSLLFKIQMWTWCSSDLIYNIPNFQLQKYITCRDGNGAERGQRMGSSSPSRMDFSCPIPAPPRPLRPREDPRSPALHRKTLFLVNFPYNYYHFSNKMTYFNNKNILKIINKFILSNQTNFQQKLNNII